MHRVPKRVEGVEVDPAALAEGGPAADAEVARATTALHRTLAAGADAVPHVPVDDAPLVAVGRLEAAGRGSMSALSARIAAGLARIVAAPAPGAPIGALVLTGGETARAVCDALGITGMALSGEVEVGVPMGRALGRPLDVVTKAGAFGDAMSLVNARHTLKARMPCPAL